MANWSNYVGSLNMPRFEDAVEERIELHLSDGRAIAYSTKDIAEQDAAYYRQQSLEAEVVVRTIHVRLEIPW